MKKLLLLLAVTMMAISTGLSLEPTRVSVYAPQHRANPDGTPATQVRVDLVNYQGGAATLYTGHTFSGADGELTADDNGIITVNVGAATPAAQAAWDLIDAGNMNSFWTFDVYINNILYSQGRIDQQVIIQSNTSIFNTNGVLVPTSDPSFIGDDAQRHDAIFLKEIDNTAPIANRGVFIGPADGLGADDALTAGDEVLAIRYDDVNNEGEISVDGVDMMVITDTDVDLQGKILENVAEINDGNQALEISGAFTATQDMNVIGTNATNARKLTITGVPTTVPFIPPFPNAEFELLIDGDAKVTGYLELNGLSLLGDLNMNDNDIYAVNEIRGRGTGPNLNRLLINQTNNGDVLFGNGAITSGTGQVTLGGNLDANAGVNVTGGDFTVEDANNNFAFEVDVTTSTPNSVINLGHSSADEINFDGWVDTDIIPTNNNDLGQDSDRWRSIYLDESLHIGPDDGASNDTELEVFYNSNTANFQVNDPTGSQFAIDATTGSEVTTFDPAGEGFGNVFIAEDGLHVDTDGILSGTVLSLTQSTVGRNSANTETLGLVNGGAGVLDVTIDGKLDVQSAASTIGDGADATQLTVEGDNVGATNALVVQGNTSIDGNTFLGSGGYSTNSVTFNSRIDSHLRPLTDDTYSLGSGTYRWQNLNLSNNANVGNDLDVDNDANVDGNTTLNGNVDLGDDLATDLTTFNSKVNSSIQPNGAATAFTLGTDAERWADLYVLGGSVHVGDANGAGAGAAELNIGWAGNQATFNVDNAGTAQLRIDAANSLIRVNADGTTGDEIYVDGANDQMFFNPDGDANQELVINSITNQVRIDPNSDNTFNYTFENTSLIIDTDDAGAGVDLVVTEGGINRNDAAVQTFTFANTGDNLNVVVDGNIDVQSAASTIGDGTDAAQLTVEGLVGTNDVLAVVGNTNITGNLDVENGVDVTGANLTVGGANFFVEVANGRINTNHDLVFTNVASKIFNSAGNVHVNDIFEVTNTNTTNTVFSVQNGTGNTVITGTLDQQGVVSNSTGADVLFEDNVTPNTDATHDLGTSALQWNDLHLANDANIGNNAEIDNDANVGNDLDVVGATTLNGNVNLGDAAADEVTVTGRIHSDLIPSATADNRDIGSASREWRSGFFSNNMNVGNNANIGANARIDGDMRLNDDDQSNYVGFTSPSVVANNVVWTLPAADGTLNQQLITDGSGNLSWGDASLQTAYEGGNTITTANANGNVEIIGSEVLDVRVDIIHTGASAVTVDDDLDVNGNLQVNNGTVDVFTVNGTNGATVISGNLDANNGIDVTNADLTVGGNNFRVAHGTGNTDIQGVLTLNGSGDFNDGLDVSGSNFTVGTNNFIVNSTNGNTDIGGTLGLNTATTGGNTANVFVINNFGASTYNLNTQMGAHPDGSVVYIRFIGTLPSGVQDQNGTTGASVRGVVAINTAAGWNIVSTFDNY